MRTREIVQVRAKDFHTAVYVEVDIRTQYLVSTDELCPDCTTPLIEFDDPGDTGSPSATLRTFHDVDCFVARLNGEATLDESAARRVAEARRRYLDELLEMWPELA
jgi:hypothetical protein